MFAVTRQLNFHQFWKLFTNDNNLNEASIHMYVVGPLDDALRWEMWIIHNASAWFALSHDGKKVQPARNYAEIVKVTCWPLGNVFAMIAIATDTIVWFWNTIFCQITPSHVTLKWNEWKSDVFIQFHFKLQKVRLIFSKIVVK